MSRADIIEQLAVAITAVRIPHPVRVGVQGIDASGKTSLADELAPAIQRFGRACLRASLDDFHPPGHKHRSASGGYTAETYYTEGFDYAALRRLLLDPLGPKGNRRCRLHLFDSYHDRPFPEEWQQVASNAIVVIDGAYLFHPEIASCWDYTVWLEVDFDTALERARKRDIAWTGPEDVVVARYVERNFPAFRNYVATTRAPELADAVIDNSDPAEPRLVTIGG